MWSTDVLTLIAHQKRIAMRRGEDKRAIYYDPAAFRPIDEFIEQLKAKHYTKLAATLIKSPLFLIE
jgi:hypothetical protein